MNILYLAHRIPYPPNKGDKIRSFNEIKYLSRHHEIDLACLADDPDDLKYQTDLEKYCSRVFVQPLNKMSAKIKGLLSLIAGQSISVGYFWKNELQSIVDKWLSEKDYNAIICFSSPMAEYVFRSNAIQLSSLQASRPPGIQADRPLHVMDYCDLDSDKWRQYSEQSKFPLNYIYELEFIRLLQYEKKVNKAFDHSIFVTQNEADLFSKLFPEAKNVRVIPNGVDTDYFSPEYANKPNAINQPDQPNKLSQPILLFTGAMDYHANINGMIWFCDKILPMIRKKNPQVQFYIVGSNPSSQVKALDNKNGVNVTGFVDDIRSYYSSADVCVIPLRHARGIQNKVLEAMAMGKPVISTSNAADGIDAIFEEHLLVTDNPIEFASKVASLMGDQASREQLGVNARSFVKKKFNWQANMDKLDGLLDAGKL